MNPETLAYIPQRSPFVMIDTITSADGEVTTTTSFHIKDDNIFNRNGHFTEAGLVENMAQTAGAGTGYRWKMQNKPAPGGYIAGLRNLHVTALPATGDTITTETTFVQTLLNFHLVKATVTCNGRDIATCELKIFMHFDTPVSA